MEDQRKSEEMSSADFEDLPSTNVHVDYHIHFGMSGSFPLQLVDLFVANDGLYVAEYAYIMPLFGLATRKHHREADAMQKVYDVHGLDEVLLQADRVTWHSYGNIDEIRIYDGGIAGRPKIAVDPIEGVSHAYRLHETTDFGELASALNRCGNHRGFSVDIQEGIGIRPFVAMTRWLNR